jgi:hypothetical protein
MDSNNVNCKISGGGTSYTTSLINSVRNQYSFPQAPLLWIQTPFYFNTSKYVETAQIPLPLSSETDNIDNYTGVIDGEIAERLLVLNVHTCI